jgi:hypothetical protein
MRRQRTKRGFIRQRDAERALREAIGSVQDGTYVEPSQDTVAQWLEEWLERRRPIDASAHSHVLPDRDAEVAATLATAILGE